MFRSFSLCITNVATYVSSLGLETPFLPRNGDFLRKKLGKLVTFCEKKVEHRAPGQAHTADGLASIGPQLSKYWNIYYN